MPDSNGSLHISGQVLAEQTHLELPSRPELIEPAVELLKQKAVLCGACSETRSHTLLIALHEALTNAIIHGNLEVASELKEQEDDSFIQMLAVRAADPDYAERRVKMVVDYDGTCCRWIISDQGRGFNVDAILARLSSDDPEMLVASGRGILLMRSFMDEVQYELGGRRVVLTLFQESGQERRHRQRVSLNTRLEVAPLRADGTIDWDAAQEAIARNFSQDGVSLIQNELAQTDRIIIGIYSGQKPMYIPAEVRHFRTLGEDVVELGCRFRPDFFPQDQKATFDPPQDVAAAIDKLLESASTNEEIAQGRRAHPRVPYTRKIEIYTGAEKQALLGYARDLSKGGMAFLTTRVLSGKITIVFPATGEEPPLQMRTEVVRCTKLQEGFYDVGGRFLSMVAGK